jgi:cytosol alanyl aminopeptidase
MNIRHTLCLGLLTMLCAFNILAKETEKAYRLPSYIKPSFQQINLTVDPDEVEFSGTTNISLEITQTTQKVGFYQIALNIKSAQLIDDKKQVIPLTLAADDYDIQWATSPQILPVGHYQLVIAFDGKVNTTSDGMYLGKFEGRNYVFTQFEDMHARRAFPSFDEPSFKIPYQLTINAPEKHVVISNTKVASRTLQDGWQTVVFNKTKPMPTYIIAFAIGEFDSAEITGLSVPGKIYTTKGQSERTKFAVKHSPAILRALENYFGMPYPYEKLDFIAVPNFTHGAMENAGLITFRSSLLLLDDEPLLNDQTRPLNVIAHEMAHMWYGDLVTMAWWDDLWLNEAFASWMARKVLVNLYPELNTQNALVQEGAFPEDADPTTKPVKKVVKSGPDVMDGLGLNYSKGESILQMIENLVGEQKFQSAIQGYIRDNAWKNAQADDLWKVLGKVADFDVPAMMRTYLEQSAYPLVTFATNGKISQQRYHFAGAEVAAQLWNIPLSIRYKKQGKINNTMVLLSDQQTIDSKLAEAEWIYPNVNAMGYFRWEISPQQMTALLKDLSSLNGREKMNLLYNYEALLKAGETSLEQYMQVLDGLAVDPDPLVASAIVASLNELVYLVDDNNKQDFANFIESKLVGWFERLGEEEKQGESVELSKLRQSVLLLLGEHSQNQAVITRSRNYVEKYLKDQNSVPRGLASRALRITAKHGDASWFDKYLQTYLNTSDANIHATILYGMEFPQDKNLISLLDTTFNDAIGPASVIAALSYASQSQQKQDTFYNWLTKNFEKLAVKMPAFHLARMPEYISDSCDSHNWQLAKAFYGSRMDKYEGMQRSFEVAESTVKQCLILKHKNQSEFNNYLKQRANNS